ncbi:MAG: FxLYD domain-containing protein [Alphaproteobacteria bacterium]|nr:FxLYD domain-containing protein [Alphaproteobacteria bacterium]
MAALEAVEVKGVKLVAGRFKGRQKMIGTLRNTGTRTVKQIKVTISYFDGEGRLIDVATSWLSNVAFLKPGEEANFSANRSFDRKTGAPAKRVTVKVTALGVVDAGEK